MNVLVLCTGNSARSILLESILNHFGRGSVTAYSAGSRPVGRVNPHAVRLLAEKGHDIRGLSSKSWDVFAEPDAPIMNAVITVCGNARDEECPFWPGAPIQAHWGVEDPAAVTGTEEEIDAAFAATYDLLKKRADAFLELRGAVVGKSGMAQAMAEIGQIA